MTAKLSQIFQNIPELTQAPALERAVLRQIVLLEEKKAKRAQIWSLAGFAGSVWSLAYVAAVFGETFLQSEFWSILSLVFFDARIVASNWQAFAYSALETFPLVSVLAMLVPTMVLLWSFGKYFEWHNRFSHKFV